jgi:hypothetical protein
VLLRQSTLERIASGEVTLAFRRWLRPTVRPGGTLRTAIGVLAIDEVVPVERASLTDEEARQAGYPDRAALLSFLDSRSEGDIYRIRLRLAGPDPRVALRQQSTLDEAERRAIEARLARLDAASSTGPWAAAVLRLIAERPAVLAAKLAAQIDLPTPVFKRKVRQLKELGLTESLEIGYRLSPRGRTFLDALPVPSPRPRGEG